MGEFEASDGLRLSYRIDDFTDPWRQSETLLLLHSAMSSGERLYSWVPRLMRDYRVVRLDLRGHGHSDVPDPQSPLTLDRLVDDVREALNHVGAARAHVVGISAGGYIGQRLAMDSPERVATLALFGSAPGLKRSQAATWVDPIRRKGLRTFLAETIDDRFPTGDCDPRLVEWFLDQAGANDAEFIIRWVSLMASYDWSDELGRIRCPTLVVVPGLGKIGAGSAYAPMAERIPDVRFLTYEGTPHNVWDFAPERCVGDLIAFLRDVASRTAVEQAVHAGT